ncbi:MAG: long-chain-fatty-acid--CoA ligase [Bacillota bacterium]
MYDISYWVKFQSWVRPHWVAVVGNEVRWTYRELEELVCRLSAAFHSTLSVQQGDRVAILSANGPEYLLVLLAVARTGSVLVPLNWRLTPAELEFQLRDSGARRIFCSAEYTGVAADLTDRIGLEPPVQITRGESPPAAPLMDRLMAEAPHQTEWEPLPWDTPLMIGYTSGTTGKPKGAVLTSGNFFWNAMNDLLTIDLRSTDVTLTLLPMFHIGGLGLFTMPTLLAGGRVVIPDRFDPAQAVHLIEQERVTIVFGVPTVNKRLLEAIDQLKPDLTSIRMFYSGGAPCPVDLINAFHERGIPYGQGYGLTETAPTVFMMLKEDFRRKAGSIGRAAPFSRVRLLDPATGNPVPVGEVGEIVVKGPNVLSHYWQNPEATAQAIRDGWFHTGDLARADAEGFVTIAGRLKEMIISGGENVYPVEVEQAIQAHPAVVEAAVFGVPHPEWGEVPHAAVILTPGASLTEEALREHCAGRLGKYKIPKRFHFMADMPRNASGKVLKGELVRLYGPK